MVKIPIYYFETSDDIYLCKDCLVECVYGYNDLDSFYTCPTCENDNFTGKLKLIDGVKINTQEQYIVLKKTK